MVELVLLAIGALALATKNNVAGAAAASPSTGPTGLADSGAVVAEEKPVEEAREEIHELRADGELHTGHGLPKPPHWRPGRIAGAASGQVEGAVNVGTKKASEAAAAAIGIPGADKAIQVVLDVAADVVVDAVWQKNAAGLTEEQLQWVKGTGGQWEAATGQSTAGGSGAIAEAQGDVLERLAVAEGNDGSKSGAVIFGDDAGDLQVGGFGDGSSLAEVAIIAGAFDPRPPFDRARDELINVNFGE